MDYRHIAIDTLTEIAKENPEMSFGDILYTITRSKLTGLDTQGGSNYRQLSDVEWYGIVERAKKEEADGEAY